MKTINCKQGSSEWLQARAGVVTASEIDVLVNQKWEARTGEGVTTYLYKKLSERVMGYVADNGNGSFFMEQGQIKETIAIPFYEFTYGVTAEKVGFCVSDDGKTGCSPDALIGELGGLEIKCPSTPVHIKYLLGGRVPPEYLPQIHFSMLVTGRKDWAFCSYHPHLPPLVVRVLRSEEICKALNQVVSAFVAKLDEEEIRLRNLMESRAKSQGRK